MAKELKPKKTKNVPVKVEKPEIITGSDYADTLALIKKNIQEAQIKASLSVNKELISLYWTIGQTIAEKQEKSGWGSSVIEKLAKDLQNSFPGVDGFSRTNLFRIRAFYQAYSKIPQAVGQLENQPPKQFLNIPWGHNAVLLEKIKDVDIRLWYAQQAIEHGWSRSVLLMWIESDLYSRQGKAITNFKTTLHKPQSDLAEQVMKDPYCLDFLTISSKSKERDIEQGLMDHLQKFLIELGKGFAFVGRQYRLNVNGEEICMDMLFYNLQLRCYVVCELKAREFDSRDAGQISLYLSAVDDLLRHPDDGPTLGMLLCKVENRVKVEYVLRNFNRPISVSGYKTKLVEVLPKDLKGSLPTIEELEAELGSD